MQTCSRNICSSWVASSRYHCVSAALTLFLQRAAIRLLFRSGLLCDDEVRLQTIVPYMLTQLSDPSASVRWVLGVCPRGQTAATVAESIVLLFLVQSGIQWSTILQHPS